MSIFRMVLLPVSATYRLVPSDVVPKGKLKVADVTGPSAEPGTPAEPVRVETSPDAMSIFRMVLLPVSATYRLVPSDVVPKGKLKVADVTGPSAEPGSPAEPVRVETSPDAMSIFRMVLLPESATYRLVPSDVVPIGRLKGADVPGTFAGPASR